MYVTEEKLIKIFFIIVLICIVLAIGFFITGKTPDQIFSEKKDKEGFDLNVSGVTFTGFPLVTNSPSGETIITFTDKVINNTITFSKTDPPFSIRVVAIGGGEKGDVIDISNIDINQKTTLTIDIGENNGQVSNNATIVSFNYYNSKGSVIPSNIPKIVANGQKSDTINGKCIIYIPPIANPTTLDVSNNITQYDKDNPDIQYHNSIEDIVKPDDISNNFFPFPTFHEPDSFKYGSNNYVPNYEDSVYLSRTTGLSSAREYKSTSKKTGFCNQPSSISSDIETKCNQLDLDTCASVSCCVLLGGNKCVAGNERGPIMKSNYTDPFVINKDVYYYQGKCYGNCM